MLHSELKITISVMIVLLQKFSDNKITKVMQKTRNVILGLGYLHITAFEIIEICTVVTGPYWPYNIAVWYFSEKKWRYGFELEVLVWHTVPYSPRTDDIEKANSMS